MQIKKAAGRQLIRILCFLLTAMLLFSAASADTNIASPIPSGSARMRAAGVKSVSSLPAGLESDTSELTADADTSERIEYAIYLAQCQLGKPCASTAVSPEDFSCGGLTAHCYGKAGFSLAADTEAQSQDNSYASIRYAELKRGDLVCFSLGGSRCDHTGIYLGDGYFIHASPSAGKVILSNMEDFGSHYRQAFCWGKQIQ